MKSVGDFYRKLKPLVEAEIAGSKVLFGAEYIGQNDPRPPRVIVVPHSEAGDLGEFRAPKSAYRAPPTVGLERQWVLIECWAYDPSKTDEKDYQYDALQSLRHAVWRHAQALIRAELHSAPGLVPGIYEAKTKALITPRERVTGARCRMLFSIDFSVRDIAPTEVNIPTSETTTEII